MQIGELFILGFFGKTLPVWLKEFAARYGLGGVILFDYSCQTQQYDNNIESPEQVQRLCEEIARLPSDPMVFIDQEGGLVRRLKTGRGFAPLPSAKEFNLLVPARKAQDVEGEFCRDAAARHPLRLRARDRRRLQPRQSQYRQDQARLLRRYRRSGANALLASEMAREQDLGTLSEAFSRYWRRGGIRIRSSWIFPMRWSPSRKSCSIGFRRKCSAMRSSSATPSSGNGTRQSDDAVGGGPRPVARALPDTLLIRTTCRCRDCRRRGAPGRPACNP